MAKGKRKVHSLTGRITSKLVYEAWRAAQLNRATGMTTSSQALAVAEAELRDQSVQP